MGLSLAAFFPLTELNTLSLPPSLSVQPYSRHELHERILGVQPSLGPEIES